MLSSLLAGRGVMSRSVLSVQSRSMAGHSKWEATKHLRLLAPATSKGFRPAPAGKVRISLQLSITVSFFSAVCAFPERCLHTYISRCLHTPSPPSASQSPSRAQGAADAKRSNLFTKLGTAIANGVPSPAAQCMVGLYLPVISPLRLPPALTSSSCSVTLPLLNAQPKLPENGPTGSPSTEVWSHV